MKTLEEIKNEVAIDFTFDGYEDFMSCTLFSCIVINKMVEQIAKNYAQQVGEDVRGRCAQNIEKIYLETGLGVSKAESILSIRNTEIILP